jgi:hypothetical protein
MIFLYKNNAEIFFFIIQIFIIYFPYIFIIKNTLIFFDAIGGMYNPGQFYTNNYLRL